MEHEVIIKDEVLEKDFNIDVMNIIQNDKDRTIMIRLFGKDTHRDIMISIDENRLLSAGSYIGIASKLGIKLRLLKIKEKQDEENKK